ncbi:putative membrane protein [Paenibacillus riograndensis SBR5]|uniref:Putative membrane protein n=1 Tax=Paenibacillus riograndensis SBR5 TaxID=1073571 RepID=A0A0E4H748_9BACL|nr:putative membrane protein [Paenibacillus riograndensis SBR5]
MFIPILTTLTTTQQWVLLILLAVNIGAIYCFVKFGAGKR